MTLYILHTETGRAEQSLLMTVTAKRGDNKRFRARIKRNAYDQQSHAIAECWTPNGWTEVTRRLNFPALNVAAHSYVEKGDAWRHAAEKDAKALLSLAMELVP